MKCIQCGKPITQEKAVLCNECFAKKYTCFKSYQEHTLLICPRCDSYKYQKQWKHKKAGKETEELLKEAAQEAVLHHCQFVHQPEAINVEVKLEKEERKTKGNTRKGTVILRTETKIDHQTLQEEFELPIKIKHISCDQCGKLKTEYYEGILQLRGENKTALEKAHAFLLEDANAAEKKGVFITKIEAVKNGFDYYYTKQQYLTNITNKLVEKFGAAGKTHPELFTQKDGKDVYRVNASVRLPVYEKGALVQYKNKMLQITTVGKQVTAKDLLTEKKTAIDEPKEMKILAMPDAFKKAPVTKTRPHLEVLHPDTYQSVPVKNQIRNVKEIGKEVLVAIIEDEIWVAE